MKSRSTKTADSSSLPAILEYEGHIIHGRDEMLSLTDMWRASGSPESKRPTDWLALASTREFQAAAEASFNAGKSGIDTVRGGKAPGTWAHWQIALAYAKYLSPEFHMWCNTAVRDHMEGRTAAPNTAPFGGDFAKPRCEGARTDPQCGQVGSAKPSHG